MSRRLEKLLRERNGPSLWWGPSPIVVYTDTPEEIAERQRIVNEEYPSTAPGVRKGSTWSEKRRKK
jgi:hypothetical protein